MRAIRKPTGDLGVIQNHGEIPIGSDDVREETRLVEGRGIKIGIVSSNFDLSGGELVDILIANGDLPGPGNPNGYTQPW